ncbi:MAG: alpha/beta hydrolase-fold protein [Lentimicrobium sp.]|uniref:alpha/beta hydrolase n=1 Tax=Lentimicrobium sp. TaxID=2034841 RepID=UPI0025CED915|nr:alpha/beta hydrolase-fold protein [Lentimicrobium sp.]MCO5256038.1 alpha/beta hydrolase-fold protein [Lentimicrobium sp.]HPF63807.1 alpha/beta hydrolase-fold protein [Lentimicrobium sp.]HPJ61483.1 alpha/beta hydrolase-fold protein [Lentimicrobium sp.]
MKKILILVLTFTAVQLRAQLPELSFGQVIRHEQFPSAFVSPRNVDVWLPDGYSTGKEYAVLYMHDGQMLFDANLTWNKQEWGVDETMGKLMGGKSIRECIVVAIWNTPLRHMEYFPQKAWEYLKQEEIDTLKKVSRSAGLPPLFEKDIISDNYLKFVVTELKPFIDSTYATIKGPEGTCIAGSSMGGLISMYAICEYPEIFGGAACLSTHWPGIFSTENNPVPEALLHYLHNHLPYPGNNRIYFDYGTETLDALYEPFQLIADSIMREKGYMAPLWVTKKFPGAGHSENDWRERLEFPLLFLLGR